MDLVRFIERRNRAQAKYLLPFTGRRKADRVKTALEMVLILGIALGIAACMTPIGFEIGDIPRPTVNLALSHGSAVDLGRYVSPYDQSVVTPAKTTITNSNSSDRMLTIELTGADIGKFVLSTVSLTVPKVTTSKGQASFTIAAMAGQPVGTYRAGVAVKEKGITQLSFTVEFTVSSGTGNPGTGGTGNTNPGTGGTGGTGNTNPGTGGGTGGTGNTNPGTGGTGGTGGGSITQPEFPAWYVAASGNNSNAGTDPLAPLATVAQALARIKTAYGSGTWKMGDSAIIMISGTITAANTGSPDNKSMLSVSGAGYPPIILRGDPVLKGTLNANANGRALFVSGNTVTLDKDLTFTGGNPLNGGGVYIKDYGHFIMKGGEIRGNTAENGGGVLMDDFSTFEMSGGSITGNRITRDGNGAGIYVSFKSVFTVLSGSVISNNGGSTTKNGGGIFVNGNGELVMKGGEISGNTVTDNGGGVNVAPFGKFTLDDGTISGNTAGKSGGGVYAATSYSAKFFHNGGTVTGNTPNNTAYN